MKLLAIPKYKYRNIPERGYASRREALRAQELELMVRAGKITNLRSQVVFELIPKQADEQRITYRADFVYEKDGAQVVEDVKSVITRKIQTYIMKRKLMLFVHGIKIVEV